METLNQVQKPQVKEILEKFNKLSTEDKSSFLDEIGTRNNWGRKESTTGMKTDSEIPSPRDRIKDQREYQTDTSQREYQKDGSKTS